MTEAAETTLTALLPERTPLTIIHTHTSHSRSYDSPWSTCILRRFFVLLQRSTCGIYLWRGYFVLFLYYYFGDCCGEARVWTPFGRIAM
ncbi:uncharacterized protein LACBIDRAFT_314441 [Laccaria bicolor S238N-H82]|uniref:Predicted protein n=1 Tax=Laccaria bicolor (strain S238N-H82 / ATCC MYA-4686) TaxID=486041 RepID=B0DYK1_LACBS|nr:uncharacterized protein LACBIDRAFT_314441 [Laccaria bicolor S238N-H82]EDR00307.1 predicted protein [Laccaria bicolor S238N-H82]|eukprot:XP_001889059.1 predicted protein [Laccaria bicolor S238N-H82]